MLQHLSLEDSSRLKDDIIRALPQDGVIPETMLLLDGSLQKGVLTGVYLLHGRELEEWDEDDYLILVDASTECLTFNCWHDYCYLAAPQSVPVSPSLTLHAHYFELYAPADLEGESLQIWHVGNETGKVRSRHASINNS